MIYSINIICIFFVRKERVSEKEIGSERSVKERERERERE